jgi:hypothetical protein
VVVVISGSPPIIMLICLNCRDCFCSVHFYYD